MGNVGGNFQTFLSMKAVKLKYRFLVFLYAYMRQIDLSLDRRRWDAWTSLKLYYQSQIDPVLVSEQLLKASIHELENTPIDLVVKEPTVIECIKQTFFRLILHKHYLLNLEVLYCCKLLYRFNSFLKGDLPAYTQDVERLRNDVAQFCSYILEPKITGKDLKKAMKVEHFMQNKNMQVVRIDEFTSGI